tara:strand:+ start:364 stop:564 length:201 start_codon:yes stop_codon:yes gene_type:complete
MSSNPFEMIDPFLQKKNEGEQKLNNIKKDIIVDQFIEAIKDKDRESLLKINQLLLNRLQELTKENK